MASSWPNHCAWVWPKSLAEGCTSGNTDLGMSKSFSNSSSHWLLWMLNSMVRAALLTSVACTAPPLSCHINQLSTVPNANSPRAAMSRAPATLFKIHCNLVAEK